MWINPTGTVFFSDASRIYRAIPSSANLYRVQLYAGNGAVTGFDRAASVPIPSLQLKLQYPYGLHGDSNGNLFVADYGSNVIRKIDHRAASTVIAGQVARTASSFATGVAATSARLSFPKFLWLDSNGDLFFTDATTQVVGMVDGQTGRISRVAGSFGQNGGGGRDDRGDSFGDGGNALRGFFSGPSGLVGDGDGSLVLADRFHSALRLIAPAPSPTKSPTRPTRVPTASPSAIPSAHPSPVPTLDPTDPPTALPSDAPTSTPSEWPSGTPTASPTTPLPSLRPTFAAGFVDLIAGTGANADGGGEGGAATSTSLNYPMDMWMDSLGENLYFCELVGYRVRRLTLSTGIVTTIAGTGVSGQFDTPGPGTSIDMYGPASVKGDPSGEKLFISDTRYVWEYSVASGHMKVIAGYNDAPFSPPADLGDGGPATAAFVKTATGLWLSTSGYLLYADTDIDRIRRIDLATNIISTFAGAGRGSGGDTGPATSAQFHGPWGVWGDSVGNVFITDTSNSRIRVVDAAGSITTFAGQDGLDYPSTADRAIWVSFPFSVVGDQAGNIYTTSDCRIMRISKETGELTSLLGTDISIPVCDTSQLSHVPVTSAAAFYPLFLFLSPNEESLYFSESQKGNIRASDCNELSPVLLLLLGESNLVLL